MARITANWLESADSFENFVQELDKSWPFGLQMTKSQGDTRTEKGMRLSLPKHRWALGSDTENRMGWAAMYAPLCRVVRDLFLNYPKGYLALVASSSGDIKEIVFLPGGEDYHAFAVAAGREARPAVMLLAVHKSFAIQRAYRKFDSVTTNLWYKPLTAPLDLSLYIEKSLKERWRNRDHHAARV